MDVLFDFYPDDGPKQEVRVFNCAPYLLDQLKAGHGNTSYGDGSGNSIYALECQPEGASFGQWTFRASRVNNVRVAV